MRRRPRHTSPTKRLVPSLPISRRQHRHRVRLGIQHRAQPQLRLRAEILGKARYAHLLARFGEHTFLPCPRRLCLRRLRRSDRRGIRLRHRDIPLSRARTKTIPSGVQTTTLITPARITLTTCQACIAIPQPRPSRQSRSACCTQACLHRARIPLLPRFGLSALLRISRMGANPHLRPITPLLLRIIPFLRALGQALGAGPSVEPRRAAAGVLAVLVALRDHLDLRDHPVRPPLHRVADMTLVFLPTSRESVILLRSWIIFATRDRPSAASHRAEILLVAGLLAEALPGLLDLIRSRLSSNLLSPTLEASKSLNPTSSTARSVTCSSCF